jgi:hypothetical protein
MITRRTFLGLCIIAVISAARRAVAKAVQVAATIGPVTYCCSNHVPRHCCEISDVKNYTAKFGCEGWHRCEDCDPRLSARKAPRL